MAKNEEANVSRYYVPNLGTGHYIYMWGGGGGRRKSHGVGQAYFILEKRKGVGQKRFSRWLGVGHCVFCKESHSLQFMWKI